MKEGGEEAGKSRRFSWKTTVVVVFIVHRTWLSPQAYCRLVCSASSLLRDGRSDLTVRSHVQVLE